MQYGEAFTTLRGSVDLFDPASETSQWIEADSLAMPEILTNKSKTSSKANRMVSQGEMNNHHLRNEVRRLQAALVDRFRGNNRFMSGGGFKGNETSHGRQCDECNRMQKALRRSKMEIKELRAAAEVQQRQLTESELLRENFASQLLKQRKVAFESQGRSALSVDRVLQGRHRTLEQQKLVVELESTIQSLRDELENVHKDWRTEQAETAGMRKNAEGNSLALKRANEKIGSLVERLDRTEQTLLDSARLRDRVGDLEFETKTYQRQLKEAQQELLESSILGEGLKQEMKTEQKRSEQAEKQIGVLSAETKHLQGAHEEQLAGIEEQVTEKDEQIKLANALVRRLQQKLDLVEGEIDDRRRERREREDEIRERDMRLADLKEAVTESRRRHSHSRGKADEELGLLRAQCAAQEQELQKLRAEAATGQAAVTKEQAAANKAAEEMARERMKVQQQLERQERERKKQQQDMEDRARQREQQQQQQLAREREEAAARARQTKGELMGQINTREEQMQSLRKQMQEQQEKQQAHQEQQMAEEQDREQLQQELGALETMEADLRAQLAAHVQQLEEKESQRRAEEADAAKREQGWERGREEERQDYEKQCAELAAALAEMQTELKAQRQMQKLEDSARHSTLASARQDAQVHADEAARAKEALTGMETRLKEAQQQAAAASQVAGRQAGRQAREAAGEYLAKNLVQMCVVAPMVTVNWGDTAMRFKTQMPSAQIKRTLEAGVLPRFVSIFLQEPEGEKQEGAKGPGSTMPGCSPLGDGQTLHEWVAGQGAEMQHTLEEELRPVFEAAMPAPTTGVSAASAPAASPTVAREGAAATRPVSAKGSTKGKRSFLSPVTHFVVHPPSTTRPSFENESC
jgi:hypothetical protein